MSLALKTAFLWEEPEEGHRDPPKHSDMGGGTSPWG